MNEDDDILAAEHVLGLADAGERIGRDPAFAAAVQAWATRLDPLLGPDRAAPAELWARISARLPANDPGVRDPVRPWRWATLAASAVAAVLLGLLLMRPTPQAPARAPVVAEAEAPVMAASLTPKQGTGAVTISYSARDGRMVATPIGMDAGGKSPELWVIGADGRPHSLGVIKDKAPASMIVPAGERAMLANGVTLAVSLEPLGGSPTGQPTGPVVMSGTMSLV
jgi:anti-sigma-K factor RskA